MIRKTKVEGGKEGRMKQLKTERVQQLGQRHERSGPFICPGGRQISSNTCTAECSLINPVNAAFVLLVKL